VISGEPKQQAGSRPAGDTQSLREHLRRRPDDGAAWLALAQALIRTLTRAPQASADAPQNAELHHALEQAIRSLPESLDAWLLAANVHQRQRGPAAALQWLQFSARQNPQLSAPRVAMSALQADGHRLAGRWTEALAAYREVERSRAHDPWLLNNIGTCLASLEDYGQAAGYFERALRLQPDFPEARLNIGFLRACQGRNVEAAGIITDVLQESALDPATQQAAATLRDNLAEQQRLEPYLQDALRSGAVTALQRALDETPPSLGLPHEPSLARLRALAEPCRGLVFEPGEFRHYAGTAALPLLEACVQCNLEGGAAAMVRVREELAQAPDGAALTVPLRQVRNFLHIARDRRASHPRVLAGPEGEAWLRYWHARLLRDAPEKQPGQYKVAANAIKNLPLTPAESVAGTFRALLSELLPAVPEGLPRGLLLYIAVNMIHGFADGNGRLSRFLLAWETESAGLSPIIIPTHARRQVARALDAAWLHGELQPLLESVRLAQAEVARLLREIGAAGGDAPP
jgi:tetratricopeptide (TPR) repeat protein